MRAKQALLQMHNKEDHTSEEWSTIYRHHTDYVHQLHPKKKKEKDKQDDHLSYTNGLHEKNVTRMRYVANTFEGLKTKPL